MTKNARPTETITAALVEDVCAQLREGKPVRKLLPYEGRLHIERQLPFLCLYRDPVGRSDPDTERLVSGEASYLICSAHRSQRARVAGLVDHIAATMSREFGAFLLLEIWAGSEVEEDENIDPEAVRPSFCIQGDRRAPVTLDSVTEVLERRLKEIRVLGKLADVQARLSRRTWPPRMPSLIGAERRLELNASAIGLEIQPIYRNPDRGEDFPMVLRRLHRGVARALKRTLYEFTRVATTHRPRHYLALGQRSMTRAVWDVDRRMAQISSAFEFLLQLTPINITDGWYVFKRNGCQRQPQFHYRPRTFDPNLLKRRLFAIDVDRVEDPTLGDLFQEKREELDRQLTMVLDRGTRNVLYGSLQLYGAVDSGLLRTAVAILEQPPGKTPDDITGGTVTAAQFATRAAAEIASFKETLPEIQSSVIVTREVAGLMVSRGNLFVGASTRVSPRRVEALIHHEVGTHLLTYWNARQQTLGLLSEGLAGYDELQEGVAVLSEHLVGGLNRGRLRLLAARVVAAHCVENGADFVETFTHIHADHRFDKRTAYRITSRIYRGGGLTKDAVYLRGLIGVLAYLAAGGDFETLLIGKIALKHLPIVRELRLRQVLLAPVLRPSFLERPETQARLMRLAEGMTPAQLVNLGRRRARPLSTSWSPTIP